MFQRLNYLAPAGNFSSPLDLVHVWHQIRRKSGSGASFLADSIGSLYPNHSPILYSSGTESLYQLFKSIRNRTSKKYIAISAYSCPDIAAAAIRAGFTLALLDIDPNTLSPLRESLPVSPTEVVAIVLSNLYGLPDALEPWAVFQREFGWTVIDDACQSALSFENGTRIGGRENVFGVLSFGRGKAFCGVGGGALLIPKAEVGTTPFQNNGDMGKETFLGLAVRCGIDFGRQTLSWLLEHPPLYKLPSAMPWLRLGETSYQENFSLGRIRPVQCFSALHRIECREGISEGFVQSAEDWMAMLPPEKLQQPYIEHLARYANGGLSGFVVPIRYPILLEDGAWRDKVYQVLQRAASGVSLSYPKCLNGFRELNGKAVSGDLLGALSVSERILTLPVHEYVTSQFQDRISSLMKREMCG